MLWQLQQCPSPRRGSRFWTRAFATAAAFSRVPGTQWLVRLILVAAIFGLFQCFNGNFVAASRLLFSFDRRGTIPANFARNSRQVPDAVHRSYRRHTRHPCRARSWRRASGSGHRSRFHGVSVRLVSDVRLAFCGRVPHRRAIDRCSRFAGSSGAAGNETFSDFSRTLHHRRVDRSCDLALHRSLDAFPSSIQGFRSGVTDSV